MFNYFEGNGSVEEAVDKIKVNTRRYAKKQITWFQRDKGIKWFHPDDGEDIVGFVEERCLLG